MAEDWRQEADERRARITAFLDEHKLTIESVFVPWKQSRNKAEKDPSLNWRVTFKRDGREILTADYSAGSAHCPSYVQAWKPTYEQRQAIERECSTGRSVKRGDMQKPILPDRLDVIASFVSDAQCALNAGDFESFAADFGYDTDSRKAESIYRACADTALKLTSALGSDLLAKLGDIYADW
jgi:hypothetical protein